jgi:hypothetical protein
MKQGLLLMAIYTLIINQARKDNYPDIPEEVLKKIQATVPLSSFKDELQINKYAFLGQSVFLLSAKDNRSFMMLEDGTCYEVIDHLNEIWKEASKNNPDYYTNAVYKKKNRSSRIY